VLDTVWALKHLKANGADASVVLNIFEAENTQAMRRVIETVMGQTLKVFYFERETGITKDISELDPSAEEEGHAGWGGLSEFSGRVNEAVARSAANPQPELFK
jgi:hypothetical protein